MSRNKHDNAANMSEVERAPPEGYDVQIALAVEKREREMKFSDVLEADRRVIVYALCFSGTIIMEGFGLALITLFYSYPTFQRKYGVLGDDGKYNIEVHWKALLPILAQIGSLVGVSLVPALTARLGYKKTVLIMLALGAVFMCLQFWASSVGMLAGAYFLLGIPWGTFQVISPSYASELASLQLRPILTTWNNLCWVIGQFLAAGITKAFESRTDEWGFRIPFAFGWVFSVVLGVAIFLSPESPYWHLQHGRVSAAKNTLIKFVRRGSPELAEEKCAFMQHQLEHDKKTQGAEKKSGLSDALSAYTPIFKGVDRTRTEIASITWLIQAVCGSSIIGWAPTFFQEAGMSVSDSYSINMAVPGAGALGTIASWFLMNRYSGRVIYFYGLLSMTICLLIFGFASFVKGNGSGWMAGGMLCVFTLFYDLTVGPITYALVSEIPSIRRRAATISAARGLYLAVNLVNMVINPLMVDTWKWGVKAGFFYAACCGLGAVYTFFRIPDTKGISARGLDLLFENGISPRAFNAERAAMLDNSRAIASETSLEKATTTERH